jgi:tetratricopeptide (TPR) repeat protein
MVAKVLHAGNIAVVIGSVAAAADVTVTGGAGAAIATALSGVELFKKADKNQRALARELATAYDAHIANSHLPEGRTKVLRQMIAQFPVSLTDMAQGGKIADVVATVVCARIKTEAADPAKKSKTALGDYHTLLAKTLVPFLEPQDDNDAMLQELLRRTTINDAAKRLHESGVTENTLIKQARRMAGDTPDLEAAWAELQNAMEIAVKVQADGHSPSNHGDFVDEVMRRVAELAAQGEYASASAQIAEALDEGDAAYQAKQTRLMGRGVDIALLDGDSAGAAQLLVRKADMEAGGQIEFEDLRRTQNTYYEKGRDKGIALDLKVAIDLAQMKVARARTADERGTALNDLGAALQTLGERDSDTQRLEQAVVAYERALEEWTQDRVPMDWATTQNNLGNALAILGNRESDTQRLEHAVVAYERALEEWTQDRVPMDWATTQNNLGAALKSLGERDSDTKRLEPRLWPLSAR